MVSLVFSASILAHNTHEHSHCSKNDRHWMSGNKHITGALSFMKNGMVYIERNHDVISVPYATLSKQDRDYVDHRYEVIRRFNLPQNQKSIEPIKEDIPQDIPIAFVFLGIAFLSGILIAKQQAPRFAMMSGALFIALMGYGFNNGYQALTLVETNPLTMDSAFTPFRSEVVTSWDNTYFRVGSIGIAKTHEMMKGIRTWQQQVPIPQCYLNANAWSIPLNPVMAQNSIPVDQKHFTRGAIAIAINGIPIFNPYTNTGIDAYVDGQLDDFGGHSGRADDYHYHIAPTHLYAFTSTSKPIAYAFDGFAIYGALEPDGSAMKTLDSHHGHADASGVYHYHGTNSAPYMIASFAGEVTEDSTYQLIPQAAAKGVRPALTPLKGAAIIALTPNGSNSGYGLKYTLNGQTYSLDYSWTPQGNYTYVFNDQNGNRTNNYKGNPICTIPTTSVQEESIKPRFTYDGHFIRILNNDMHTLLSLHLYDMQGRLIRELNGDIMQMNGLHAGLYFLHISPFNSMHAIMHKQ
ncbi:MAG: YHYH protein [Candidatus Kapaibacteriota bacterium]